jgi:flagellar biosynthesis/type III secretory pathway protein FliH
MESLPAGSQLKAMINPDDEKSILELLSAEIDAGRLELIADPGISLGGVVVESGVGTMDATIETAEESARLAATGGGDD